MPENKKGQKGQQGQDEQQEQVPTVDAVVEELENGKAEEAQPEPQYLEPDEASQGVDQPVLMEAPEEQAVVVETEPVKPEQPVVLAEADLPEGFEERPAGYKSIHYVAWMAQKNKGLGNKLRNAARREENEQLRKDKDFAGRMLFHVGTQMESVLEGKTPAMTEMVVKMYTTMVQAMLSREASAELKAAVVTPIADIERTWTWAIDKDLKAKQLRAMKNRVMAQNATATAPMPAAPTKEGK